MNNSDANGFEWLKNASKWLDIYEYVLALVLALMLALMLAIARYVGYGLLIIVGPVMFVMVFHKHRHNQNLICGTHASARHQLSGRPFAQIPDITSSNQSK